MTLADKLNLCGILLTGAGSTIAMVRCVFSDERLFCDQVARHSSAALDRLQENAIGLVSRGRFLNSM